MNPWGGRRNILNFIKSELGKANKIDQRYYKIIITQINIIIKIEKDDKT